jgi:hypothetical protein
MSKILVFGRARGVWDEIEAAKALGTFDKVIAAGMVGIRYPGPLDYWASWHANHFPRWMKERAKAQHPPAGEYWSGSHRGARGIRPGLQSRLLRRGEYALPDIQYLDCAGGSSGFLATWLACQVLGGQRIVLAGIPLSPERGHDGKDGVWEGGLKFRTVWEEFDTSLQGRVRSMSGWTAEQLGMATGDWFNSTELYAPLGPAKIYR